MCTGNLGWKCEEVEENAEKVKVWRENVGWKCARSVGKRRESEALESSWRLEV